MNKSILSNNKFFKTNAKLLVIIGGIVLFLIIIWYAKFTWDSGSSNPTVSNLPVQ